MKIKFYDTSSLLKQVDSLFETEELIAISSITFEELENIKTAANKDADISAVSHNKDADIFCSGSVVNYGAVVNAKVDALGGNYNKVKN